MLKRHWRRSVCLDGPTHVGPSPPTSRLEASLGSLQPTAARLFSLTRQGREERPERSVAAHDLPKGRAAVGLGLFCIALFLLGDLAVAFSRENSDVAAWWPAAGLSVGVLTVFYRSKWMLAACVLVFTALANWVAGRHLSVSIGFGLANTCEALVGSWWLQRSMAGRPLLHAVVDVWRLAGAALLGATTIGIGAGLTVALLTDGDGIETMLQVIPSHGAAVLLIVPLALSAASAASRGRAELVANWAITALVVGLVFGPGQTLPLAFVAMMPMVWAGLRLGVRHVAAQLIAVGLAVTFLTGQGTGPLAAVSETQWSSTALVQMFIIVSSLVLLSMAVATSERERALARAIGSEELFRLGFEEALVGMILVRTDKDVFRVVEANHSAQTMLGVKIGDEVPSELRDDDFRSLEDITKELRPDDGWRGEMNHVTSSREVARFNVALSLVPDAGGGSLATCQIIDVSARYHAELELKRQALRDHMTGLPNSEMFNRHLRSELLVAAERHRPLAVMYLDLDDFKLLNDGSGHRAGDKILAEIGRRIATVLRPGDMVARMGGDEFALVCSDAGTPMAAVSLAERVQNIAEEVFVLEDHDYRIGLSIGVAFSTHDSTANGLLGAADIALYAAKASGKRGVRLYSDELGEAASARVRLESDLNRAEEQREFEMFEQPVVEMGTGRIRAAEALIRWNHPTRGRLAPDEWLGIAERSGMMPTLGAWVLDESCRQASQWGRELGRDDAPAVHVNVSARQLEAPGFAQLVVDTLDRHALPPDRLVIELTETYLAQIGDYLVTELESLSELGVQLAADDFGTGYSPLTRITELPVKIIKIDKQFIDHITTDQRARAIVASLVELASTLDLSIVGEGVETLAQAQVLSDMGCRAAQGYLWSPAVGESAFRALLHSRGRRWPTVVMPAARAAR